MKIFFLFWFLVLRSVNAFEGESNNLVKERSLPQILSENNTNFQLNYKTNGVISKYEFDLLQQNLISVESVACKRDLRAALRGIIDGEQWAIAMYDSSAKSPSGIETGSVYQLGNFDECININDDDRPAIATLHIEYKILSKYCLLDVITEGYTIRSQASRKTKKENSTTIHWGICMPATCSLHDIESFMKNVLQREVHLDEDKCYEKKPFEATNGMIIYGSIVLCFVILTLSSTFYHFYAICVRNTKKRRETDMEMLIKSFSIIENFKKFFQKSNDHLGLNAINGIKALAMILIISGHSLIFIISGPQLTMDFEAQEIKRVQNGFLFNSVLFVDSFLLLSGFLFCRILLRELERRQGKINPLLLYIFRFIRLTPAYLAVIAFYITWFPAIGSGPLWNQRIGLEQKRCSTSWWLNLLYINNYIGTDNLCMFQSWYLSTDTQLFMLAPIVIYLLYKNRKAGIRFLILLAIFTSVLPATLTYLNYWDPTLLVFEDENRDISSNYYFLASYIKTHMRATGYVFGLITGFILHYINEKGIKLSKRVVYSLWIISVVIGTASMFSVVTFYIDTNFTPFQSALYAGLHRMGWSLSVGWLIIASTTGNAGILEKILTSRFFAPLSRLTYCSYLTNGLVELYTVGTTRVPVQMNHINLFGTCVSHGAYTLVTAVVLCLLFESPIHGIERILLRKEKQRRESLPAAQTNGSTPSTSEENS